MAKRYQPEIMDMAMKIWVQNNHPPYTEIARRLEKMYGISIAPSTIKRWHDSGLPINWEEFDHRYRATLYATKAKRMAEEAAEVREQTWIAMRMMLKQLIGDMQRYMSGELELKYRSADALVTTLLRVVTAYYKLFGDAEEKIDEMLEGLPDEIRVKFRDALESEIAAEA